MPGATVTVRPEEFSASSNYEDTPMTSYSQRTTGDITFYNPRPNYLCARHQRGHVAHQEQPCHQPPYYQQPYYQQPYYDHCQNRFQRSNLKCTCRPCQCHRRPRQVDCLTDCRNFWLDVGQCFTDCGLGIIEGIMGCLRDCVDFGRGCVKGCTPEKRPCQRCNMGNQCPRHEFYY